MQINDTTWESIDQEVGNHGQETCQDNELHVVFPQHVHHVFLAIQLLLIDYGCRNIVRTYTLQGVCICFITDDDSAMDAF